MSKKNVSKETTEEKETVQENQELDGNATVQEDQEQDGNATVQEDQEQDGNAVVQGDKELEKTGTANEEQILFCVTPKVKKIALRSTPEFRLDNKNLVGIVDENSETRTFKIVEQKNGYGRLQYPEKLWIDLKECNRF